MKTLTNEACKELELIADTHTTAAANSANEAWKWYNQGKADGIKTVLKMLKEVDDHYDSRDPDYIFKYLDEDTTTIHHTLQVNESNVNAVVATLIDNKYRVVVKNIYEISENMTTWEIEYWKE